jgi:hypothetical protein
MSINDPYGLGNDVSQGTGNILGGQLSSGLANYQKMQSAQAHFSDTTYIAAHQVLSIHKLSHGWIVKCGQKTYPCSDEVQQLLDTISLALVHHSMDTNK